MSFGLTVKDVWAKAAARLGAMDDRRAVDRAGRGFGEVAGRSIFRLSEVFFSW